MKKLSLFLLLLVGLIVSASSSTFAQTSLNPLVPVVPVVAQGANDLPAVGSWILDPEVTKIGKNAVRSGNLLDWTLHDYQWASASAQQYSTSSLVSFWLIIQRIVYALFLFVVLVTAFILIVTRGRSLSARRFLPRFFLVVLLVTFSFSLVQFLYQIVDIFQGFFLKNPAGGIISSRDLLFIGFDYKDFQGLRLFGPSFDESAFTSLLLVKLTSFTYYVMAILLIFRKIIMWFLIIISPVFPLLLLFYPLRNTAKIWIGEFFRWLLYAPLFAIFLSGLVKLWQSPVGLPLFFNFQGAGTTETYPTAVNILLGGPGQSVFLHNSVNLPDTFALYLVALLMLWAVILLPFILLQIFLDYMMSFNYKDNPLIKQVYSMLNTRTNPIIPPPLPPAQPAGLARTMPFVRRFGAVAPVPITTTSPTTTTTGRARQIPRSIGQRVTNQATVTNLTNLAIPTLRDIARFETTKLSRDTRSQQEITRVQQTLANIGNPASTSSIVERDRYRLIRDRLVTEVQKGNQVASTVLNAATTYASYSSSNTTSSSTQIMQQLLQKLAQPEKVTSKREVEKIVQIKEQLTQAAATGNQFAQKVLTSVTNVTNNQATQIQELLQKIGKPETVTNTTERQTYTQLREKITAASKSGNPLAVLLSSSLEKSTSQQEVKKIQDELVKAQTQGNPLASQVLNASSTTKRTRQETEALKTTLEEASKKGEPLATLLLQMLTAQKDTALTAPVAATAKLKKGAFPVVNRIQQVSLDDYEAVRKMWKENYHTLEVPQAAQGQKTRKEWISSDIASIEDTINSLSSTNAEDVEKGMQQVSDILPFLLIGGFSQTEIVAYLKAKLEAGKSVLEEVGTKEEEEDTLLAADHAAKTVLGHLAATREVAEPTTETAKTEFATQNNTTINNNYQTENSVKSEVAAPVTFQSSPLLELSQLPIITMRDIVRFESLSGTNLPKERLEHEKVRSILQGIATPESASQPSEQERFTKLRQEVLKEKQKGNPLADLILDASTQVGTPALHTQIDIKSFISLLQLISDPSASKEQSNEDIKQISTQFSDAKANADPLTLQILHTITEVTTSEKERTKEFLEKLSSPMTLATATEQMRYNKLVERIGQASSDGNQLAITILKLTREPLTDEKAGNLATLLSTATIQGDPLATYISSTMYSLSPEVTTNVTSLYQDLITGKTQGDPLSASLMRLFKKSQKTGEGVTKSATQGLPKQNRLQHVSLEDYETVKKMWIENYTSAEPPTAKSGKQMTRKEWLSEDKNSVTTAINLLSSTNPADVQKGMEQIGEILPFLLLGGFSQSEIVGYLKAKLEADNSVMAGIDQQRADDDTLLGATPGVHIASEKKAAVRLPENPKAGTPQAKPILSTPQDNGMEEVVDTDAFLQTIRLVLDPSLVADPAEQQTYRTAREKLIEERQSGNPQAVNIMKLVDKVSQQETEEVAKLLKNIDSPQLIVDDKERDSYESLKKRLSSMTESDKVAASVITTAHATISPVSANKVRVLLSESALQHDPLAQEIMKQYIKLSQPLREEITMTYQATVDTTITDPFTVLLRELLTKQKNQIRGSE